MVLNVNSLTFPWLFPTFIFFPDHHQNSLTNPWLLPGLEFSWLFPDRWTPCDTSSDKGLSPGRHLAIIWTNAGMLLIGPLGANFREIFIKMHTFSFKKMHLKMPPREWRPFCLGLNVLTGMWWYCITHIYLNLNEILSTKPKIFQLTAFVPQSSSS